MIHDFVRLRMQVVKAHPGDPLGELRARTRIYAILAHNARVRETRFYSRAAKSTVYSDQDLQPLRNIP